MAWLVYCIMKDAAFGAGPITGVNGKEVSFVAAHGLCAAVSEMSSPEGAPPVSELLAYGKVVEDLHRLQAVVPMRFGCVLEGVPDVRRLLNERKRQYESLLEELKGRVEMGIRVLLPEPEEKPRREERPRNGRGYLALRKAHYRGMEETSRDHEMLLSRHIDAFSGLYDRCRTAAEAKGGSVVLSLYFLVPEGKVDRFTESFRRLADGGSPRTLISGPWPPYNFVTPDLAGAAAVLPRDR